MQPSALAPPPRIWLGEMDRARPTAFTRHWLDGLRLSALTKHHTPPIFVLGAKALPVSAGATKPRVRQAVPNLLAEVAVGALDTVVVEQRVALPERRR